MTTDNWKACASMTVMYATICVWHVTDREYCLAVAFGLLAALGLTLTICMRK